LLDSLLQEKCVRFIIVLFVEFAVRNLPLKLPKTRVTYVIDAKEIDMIEESDLVEKLLESRNRFLLPSNGETGEVKDIRDLSKEEMECLEHPGVSMEYWCIEDMSVVCQECLIFGKHKGHAAARSKKRLDVGDDVPTDLIAQLQDQLTAIDNLDKKYLAECNKMKSKVYSMVDEMCEEEMKNVASKMSNRKARLELILSNIDSHQVREGLDNATHLVNTTVVPSIVEREGSRLVVELPKIKSEDGEKASDSSSHSYDTNTSPAPASTTTHTDDLKSNSVRSTLTSGSYRQKYHDMSSSTKVFQEVTTRLLKSVDYVQKNVDVLDGNKVTVLKNGNPGTFYCRLQSEEVMEQLDQLEKLLDKPFQSRIDPLIPGECVLARWNLVWRRATVIEATFAGWKCRLVDLGIVVTVATLDISDLPPNVLDIPVLTVPCILEGAVGVDWTEEAQDDWEKMVKDKQFILKVVSKEFHNIVNLFLGEVDVLDSLKFLGYLPADQSIRNYHGQYFSQPKALSAAAYQCVDYEYPSPDNILLYFDNPDLDDQLPHLQQVDARNLIGPPGHVQHGDAIIAPWEGKLYRATVMKVEGINLTVFYVDFGNTDTVCWWNCFIVPTNMLFPPLATMVRLTGVREEERGSWTREGRNRLREVLGLKGEKLIVKIIRMSSSREDLIEVELFTPDRENVINILVEEGFVCGWKQEMVNNVSFIKKTEVTENIPNKETDDGIVKMGDIMEEFESDKTRELALDEIMFSGSRVYLTGSFPRYDITEHNLCTWAEELWGMVEGVKIGYKQIVIDFCNVETADLCSNAGLSNFNGNPMHIFSSKLRLSNGVLVSSLDTSSRPSDFLNIFCTFGDIAYTEGPFPDPQTGTKTGIVVFKDLKSVENVLDNCEVKLRGKKLHIERYKTSKFCKGRCVSDVSKSIPEVINTPNVDVEVEVVKVESPDNILVKLVSDEDRLTAIHKVVQAAGKDTDLRRNCGQVEIKDKVLCMVSHLNAWYRASVVEVNTKTCKVKLVDVGMITDIGMDNIFHLDNNELKKEKPCVRCVKLGRLEAAGSGGWSTSAVDFILRRIGKRKVFLSTKGDGSEDLIVEEVVADNPTDVETVNRVSLCEMLLERGLALKMNTRSKCASSWTGHQHNL